MPRPGAGRGHNWPVAAVDDRRGVDLSTARHLLCWENYSDWWLRPVGILSCWRTFKCHASEGQNANLFWSAILELNPDWMQIAIHLDNLRKAGEVVGPLHGIPFLVKDNIASKDRMETTAGSWALQGSIVPRDAHVVSKLRAAGALLLGKATLSEWADMRSNNYSEGYSARGGQARSAYNLTVNPGGSSSGSAIAVAANIAAFALGTETDGSGECNPDLVVLMRRMIIILFWPQWLTLLNETQSLVSNRPSVLLRELGMLWPLSWVMLDNLGWCFALVSFLRAHIKTVWAPLVVLYAMPHMRLMPYMELILATTTHLDKWARPRKRAMLPFWVTRMPSRVLPLACHGKVSGRRRIPLNRRNSSSFSVWLQALVLRSSTALNCQTTRQSWAPTAGTGKGALSHRKVQRILTVLLIGTMVQLVGFPMSPNTLS